VLLRNHYQNRRVFTPTMPPRQYAKPIQPSKAVVITGMFGIGDNIHQRAVLRELMKTNEVWLDTCHVALYHDLVEQGLKLRFRPTRLHAQARTIANEKARYPHAFSAGDPPAGAVTHRLWYNKPDIDKFGSIQNAMFGVLGMNIPDKPDFRLPIKDEWRAMARTWLDKWDRQGKPLMLYRPIVLREEWDSSARNPDVSSYERLFNSIRSRYFVVSIADLVPNVEWIVGAEPDADVKLHSGELDFETMAALCEAADLVFSPAGFAPILAQSVGTPTVIVYGGRESFRTTDIAGAHLSPTLGLDPINPCDCHSAHHACDKRMDITSALSRLAEFVDQNTKGLRVLVFGTTYVDSADRAKLTKLWADVHGALNPQCDFMLVDSASPMLPDVGDGVSIVQLGDNIGHLSRGGRDGWGRAFCRGLQEAVSGGYDYVAHIEGDSLFRLPILPLARCMGAENNDVISVPVRGMLRDHDTWVETGLMIFSVDYLKRSNFIEAYDWPNRQEHPTPEVVIKSLLGERLTLMPWRALRGDKNQITSDNILMLGLDWVTHCHTDSWVYDKFAESILTGKDSMPSKINFGCGANRLKGWTNVDAEVDISKPLPYTTGQTQFILAEHVVEHIDYYQAIEFFKECRRIMAPGGVCRIIVPSIEQIWKRGDRDYFQFTTQWQPEQSLRGAMTNILYRHGHKTAWTESLLYSTLLYAGFNRFTTCDPNQSTHRDLKSVDYHGKQIGERNNWIESLIVEAMP
jgi:predicted SAM-dependent methyltransferase